MCFCTAGRAGAQESVGELGFLSHVGVLRLEWRGDGGQGQGRSGVTVLVSFVAGTGLHSGAPSRASGQGRCPTLGSARQSRGATSREGGRHLELSWGGGAPRPLGAGPRLACMTECPACPRPEVPPDQLAPSLPEPRVTLPLNAVTSKIQLHRLAHTLRRHRFPTVGPA